MKNNKSIYIVGIFMLVTMVSIGYAILTGQLNINGSAKVKAASWDIYFANIKVKDGSVTPSVAASISDKTTVNFEVELSKPGDFYEFNVDVVNDGDLDAMIESINITPELTANQQKYLSYSVIYKDGTPLEVKDILHAKKFRTLKVKVEYLKSVENNELNKNDETINIKATIKYVQADNTAKTPTSQEKDIDKTAPTIENISSNVTTASSKTQIIVTFEANDENEIIDTLTENDIKVKVGGTLVTPTTKVLTSSGINNKVYTLTMTGLIGNGELTLEIDGTKISDELGNKGEVITLTPGVTIDNTVNGTNVGDQIKIGNEEFYVISNDGENITMLSKYNLLVGNQWDKNGYNCVELTNPTGIQDETAKGYDGSNPRIGTVIFSSNNYWYDGRSLNSQYGESYPTYVYDDNASIKTYVDNYKNYLESLGQEVEEARLISLEELVNLGCNLSLNTCSSAPSWVYSTSYWSGSAGNIFHMWTVSSAGNIGNNYYNNGPNSGVRPVIVIPADSI